MEDVPAHGRVGLKDSQEWELELRRTKRPPGRRGQIREGRKSRAEEVTENSWRERELWIEGGINIGKDLNAEEKYLNGCGNSKGRRGGIHPQLQEEWSDTSVIPGIQEL